jgi:hypothetical protein
VIPADDPKWIEPFSGLSEMQFARLVALVRRRGADVQRGRPWRLPLADRVLLVATYWRTNLTLRQVAPLFGVSKSAADRILDHLAPLLAIAPVRRPRKDTVYIVDGTLVPTRDRTIAASSKNYRYSTNVQVVIDANSRLRRGDWPPVARQPQRLPGFHRVRRRPRCRAAPTIADGYQDTGLLICGTADSRAAAVTRPCLASPDCTTWPSPDSSTPHTGQPLARRSIGTP